MPIRGLHNRQNSLLCPEKHNPPYKCLIASTGTYPHKRYNSTKPSIRQRPAVNSLMNEFSKGRETMKTFRAIFLICTALIATCTSFAQTNAAPWLAGICTDKPVEIAGSNVYSKIFPADVPYFALTSVPDSQVHSSNVLSRKKAKRRSWPALWRFIPQIFHKKRAEDTPLSISCRVFNVFLKSRAGAILTFSRNTIQITPGEKIKVIGTLTNTGATDIYLNGDSLKIDKADLTIYDSPFVFFGPLRLSPCHSYKGALIEVTAGAKLQTGSYSGTFTINGGRDTNSYNDLATANFTVEVISNSAKPEP